MERYTNRLYRCYTPNLNVLGCTIVSQWVTIVPHYLSSSCLIMYAIEAINHANVIPITNTHMTYRLVCCMRLSRLIARVFRVI